MYNIKVSPSKEKISFAEQVLKTNPETLAEKLLPLSKGSLEASITSISLITYKETYHTKHIIVQLWSLSVLLERSCLQSWKVSAMKLTENSSCGLKHDFANKYYILQCLRLQESWTFTTPLKEWCYWSEMFSQFYSVTVIHALWQYDHIKYCSGCLVTGKR